MSAEFGKTLDRFGLRRSSGRTGICFDNAMAESFFGALKNEPVSRVTYLTREAARQDITRYIEFCVAMLRAEPALFGPVASGPTVSHLVDTLAAGGARALAAIRAARTEARSHIWQLAGSDAPHADGQVIVDIDGVLVPAHSNKEDATRTWKKTYGHHPLMAFVDHGGGGTGEPVAGLLRPGRAAATPPPTTSRPPAWRWPSCRGSSGAVGAP